MTDLIAAIDIGTNSFHLVIARITPDSGFEIVTTQKEVVRLGSGSGDMKTLAPDAIDRGIDALTRMREVAESLGARVHAVATSAVREATNRSDFLDRARTESGVEVQVISGFEEARLIHLGLLKALPVFDRRIMGFDIGGGSTEIVVGLGSDLLAARSFRLGAIRLTERFFPGGAI
ncbi:MAG: Ppx/GppA phosphatase family protein, partial [Acidimicrobiia bacterium]